MRSPFISAAEIARTQNGRITTAQLRDCGFGKSAIARAVAAGRLHRVHVGVYAVGHLAPSRLGDWHAAVLACGPTAVLSHRCAAKAFAICDGVGPLIDVTVDPRSHRRRPGIAVHRAELLAVERGTWNGVPITSPARTLVDLAHELADPDDIAWALRELQFRRLYARTALELSLTRRPHRGLSGLLDALPAVGSRLEVAFMSRVVARHRLPEPACQIKVEGFHVDFLWASQRVIVETDGRAHDQPSMRAADAVRDAILEAAGYRVLRFRWADVHHHHARTARRIRAVLMNQGPSTDPRSSAGGGR